MKCTVTKIDLDINEAEVRDVIAVALRGASLSPAPVSPPPALPAAKRTEQPARRPRKQVAGPSARTRSTPGPAASHPARKHDPPAKGTVAWHVLMALEGGPKTVDQLIDYCRERDKPTTRMSIGNVISYRLRKVGGYDIRLTPQGYRLLDGAGA